MKRTFVSLTVIVVLGAGLLLAPVWPVRANPPDVSEPAWDSPETRALADRACFDCHSNQTVWPWYSRTLAAGWLVRKDVVEGREHLNFTDWNAEGQGAGREGSRHIDEAAELILEGKMPPPQYLILHPEARLTQAEKEFLANGLSKLD